MSINPPLSKSRKKPLGKPLTWNEDTLNKLADIGQSDLVQAQALWESEAPASLKHLLEAQSDERKHTV